MPFLISETPVGEWHGKTMPRAVHRRFPLALVDGKEFTRRGKSTLELLLDEIDARATLHKSYNWFASKPANYVQTFARKRKKQ